MKRIRLPARPLNKSHSQATFPDLHEVNLIKLMLVSLFSVLRFFPERMVMRISLTTMVIVLGMEATLLTGCGESNKQVLQVIDSGTPQFMRYHSMPPSIGLWEYKDGHLYDYQIINGELIRREIW